MASSNSSIDNLQHLLDDLLEHSEKVVEFKPPLKPVDPQRISVAKEQHKRHARNLRSRERMQEAIDAKLPKAPNPGNIISEETSKDWEKYKSSFPWIKSINRVKYSTGLTGIKIFTEDLNIYNRERTHRARIGAFEVHILDIDPPDNLLLRRFWDGDQVEPVHPHLNMHGGVCLGTLFGEWMTACMDSAVDQQLFLTNLFLTTMNDTDFWSNIEDFGFQWHEVADKKPAKKLDKNNNPFG